MAGDGQVTLGETIMKASARKIRKMPTTACSSASPAPPRTPSPCSSASRGSSRSTAATCPRAAVELAKDWRTDRVLRRLEALLRWPTGGDLAR